MKQLSDKVKQSILICTYTVVIAFILLNAKPITGIISSLFSIISPFIVAIAIAFVLNIPMKLFERKVFKFLDKPKCKSFSILKRPLSILSTFVTIILLFVLLFLFVVPQFASSVSTLLESVPNYIKSFETLISQYINSTHLFNSTDFFNNIGNDLLGAWKELLQFGGQLLGTSLSSLLDVTISFTSGVINFLLSIVLAIYMLSSKEVLIRHLKKIIYAFFSKKYADKLIFIGKLSNKTFSKFIIGQCTEACILGFLCFIGMNIFSMPYSLLISVLVGVTALIPIFGAFIGTVPSAFIILIIDPVKAFWFIVFILVLQQLEGNLIYPRVVGSSIGLSAIWVMLAMLVGGSTLGLIGMIIGIPICSIIYQLITISTNKKLKSKNIEIK